MIFDLCNKMFFFLILFAHLIFVDFGFIQILTKGLTYVKGIVFFRESLHLKKLNLSFFGTIEKLSPIAFLNSFRIKKGM